MKLGQRKDNHMVKNTKQTHHGLTISTRTTLLNKAKNQNPIIITTANNKPTTKKRTDIKKCGKRAKKGINVKIISLLETVLDQIRNLTRPGKELNNNLKMISVIGNNRNEKIGKISILKVISKKKITKGSINANMMTPTTSITNTKNKRKDQLIKMHLNNL